MLECWNAHIMHTCCSNFQIYDKKTTVFFAIGQQAHTHIPSDIMHFLQQHNNIYYTSSGPTTKVSNVKREKRKVKEKKGE